MKILTNNLDEVFDAKINLHASNTFIESERHIFMTTYEKVLVPILHQLDPLIELRRQNLLMN